MKKLNVKMIITIIIVIVFVVGVASAYFFLASGLNDKKTVQAGSIRITYSDENMDNVNLSNITPINDAEIKTKASKLEFKVTNTGNNKAYVDIYLSDIVMDSELASLDFKWALYSGENKIYNGNFKNILNNKQLLMNNIELNKNENESYQLYIWISEDNTDQGLMMNKSFSAKVLVSANQKKSNDLLTKVIKDNNPLNMDKPNFSKIATTDEGLFKAEDADGETYYFRGAVEDNYVKIDGLKWENGFHSWIVGYGGNGKYSSYDYRSTAEKECNNNYSTYGYDSSEECISNIYSGGHNKSDDMIFRIVRINGDNTIRLVANEPIGNSQFNSKSGSEEYVGYTYHEHIGYKVGEESKASYTRNLLDLSRN